MDAQATISLVVALGAGIAALVYYLVGNIKKMVEDAIDKLTLKMELFVREVSDLREKLGERVVAMQYLERRLDQLEENCRACRKKI